MLASTIIFILYNIFATVALTCLLNIFELKTTFKILFNALVFIICNSLILVLLGLDFLAIVYIIVYAGAILILFLSVLMLVNLRFEDINEIIEIQSMGKLERRNRKLLKWFTVVFYFFFNIYIYFVSFKYSAVALDEFNTISISEEIFHSRNIVYWISEIMYKQEVLLFLIIGLIFFLAMVGSVGLILNESLTEPKVKRLICKSIPAETIVINSVKK